jgi:hypothetical protein
MTSTRLSPLYYTEVIVAQEYIPYLIRRCCESRADGGQPWHEIQALGYPDAARTVCRSIRPDPSPETCEAPGLWAGMGVFPHHDKGNHVATRLNAHYTPF